ncbi:MAG: hypothetical protein Q7W45_11355 [Bacteroidota bacterium]|nr:hypothetical protein [Bacteroidota bacterium]MDP3147078.1 hypothetical protein [Bacteroidota bacterium]
MQISKNRKLEIEDKTIAETYRQKIRGFNTENELDLFLLEEPKVEYRTKLKL